MRYVLDVCLNPSKIAPGDIEMELPEGCLRLPEFIGEVGKGRKRETMREKERERNVSADKCDGDVVNSQILNSKSEVQRKIDINRVLSREHRRPLAYLSIEIARRALFHKLWKSRGKSLSSTSLGAANAIH